MFYVYSILIPLLIMFISYYVTTQKPKNTSEYVSLLLKVMPCLFGYAFFLYFLEAENYIDADWAFYTVIFFLMPIAFIAIFMKIFYWIKKSR